MAITVILGAQWGDEGKGKITDLLAAEAELVARFGGGDNAGHTVTVGTERFALHLIPSGILYPRVTCLLGGGMVINPKKVLAEMDGLAAREHLIRANSPGPMVFVFLLNSWRFWAGCVIIVANQLYKPGD